MSDDLLQHDANHKRVIIVHSLCWAVLIFLPLLFYNPGASWEDTWRRFVRTLGGPLSYMIVFYVNYLWLVPRMFFNGRRRTFVLANIVLVAVAMVTMMGWWHFAIEMFPDTDALHHRHGHRPPRFPMYFQAAIMLGLFAALSVTVRMVQQWQHAVQARAEAEQIRTEAELSNLRNQLNPHFLLNTLNNIYALTAFDSERARHAIEELSKLLRHVLYDNRENFVPLYREAEFMNNYIELMRIRVTDQVTIDNRIAIDPDDATPIAPHIFISLVENAFKHGIAPNGSGRIVIDLHHDDNEVVCSITNTYHPKRDNDKSGSGIGLEQVSKRLQLMYEGRYSWQHGLADDNYYHSQIIIRLQ